MPAARLPGSETERLRALQRLHVLDSAPEAEFDALVQAAALVCGVPISLLSLVDQERQWFKANVGLPGVTQTPRDTAFCAYAIHEDGILEVRDAASDSRFADNPLVTGNPDIRFYAGATLKLSDGANVGTLCVIDREPRTLDDKQREVLRLLAVAAAKALEKRWQALQLAASEARQVELYESTPAMLHSIDESGRVLAVSDHWLKVLGYERHEVIGRLSSDFLNEASRIKAREQVLPAFFSTGHCTDVSYQMVHKCGRLVEVELSAILARGDDQRPTRSMAVVQDVSARNAAMRSTNALLTTMRAQFIMSITDVGGRIVDANEAFCEASGLAHDALIGANHSVVASGIHSPAFFKDMWRTILAGDSWRGDICNRARDGRLFWIDSVISPLVDADGRVERFIMICRDVTDRKLQDETLRKSELMFQRTGEVAGVGGWELDLVSRALSWTSQTRRIHGVGPDYQPRLDEAIRFYTPEAQSIIEAAIERSMRDGSGWDLELPFIQATGRRIWVRSAGNVEFEGAVPVRMLGAFQDITERVLQRRAIEAASERITLATDSGQIGIWDYDLVTGSLTWDAWMCRLYGLPPDSMQGSYERWASCVHPEDRSAIEHALRIAIKTQDSFEAEFRVVWPDGSVHTLRTAGRLTRDPDGVATRMVGVNWDVTSLLAMSAQIAEQHELLKVTLQSIGDAVITTDAQGCVNWLNPVAERMTGWLSEEVHGLPLQQVFNILNEETRLPTENPVATCLKQGRIVGLANHTVLISRHGEEFGIEDSAAPIRNAQGAILGVVLVFHDVTEQRRLSGEMSYRATHDSLTGLVNRVEFESRLRRALNSAHEDGSHHALMYIDLDQFKLVNDACGHAVGDQLLQQVSKLLAEAVRARDTLARLGGDEFAILLDHCSAEQAQRVAQQICERMGEFRFMHDGRRFRIGTSIGLVSVDNRWGTTAAVMQAADTSCYAAKEGGRHRVHTWFDTDSAMRARHGELQWATRLEQAIDDGGFLLYAQRITPMRDAATGIHAEVLLRLVDDAVSGGIVLPGVFMPAAERFNLASRIDRLVLRMALGFVHSLPDLSVVDTLCINLSGSSIGDRAFHKHAIDSLVAVGADICGRLCLEITETVAITNLADAAVFITHVRALGVRIALDDFGAGASSFGYLKTLGVDLLKIDGQFIKDLIEDPLDDAAVRCFVDVARVVGVKTVAEVVDRPAVLERVRELGIDYAQGFLLHQPEPIEDLFAVAADQRSGLHDRPHGALR